MADVEMNAEQFRQLLRGLTQRQRYHVKRGCISGDFTMATVRALTRKGLMRLEITSPNGQCGFMRLTPLGERVRAYLATVRAPSTHQTGEPG